MQNTHTSSSHQVTDKDPSEPEPLQSLQKLVILGQIKVMAKQSKLYYKPYAKYWA